MSRSRPLAGVTILSLEQLMALPFGTQILADLGAEVIAVSAITPTGDEGVPWRERTGRNKRQLSIDLKSKAGQGLLRELASQVDILAENFRPGVMDRYGLGWAALQPLNPRLIYASVSGFGHADFLPSPLTHLGAYGPIGESMSGVMHAMRQAGAQSGATLALGDITSTLFVTIGILVALRHRDATGEGQYVDVSMADALLALAELPLVRHTLELDRGAGTAPPLPSYPVGVFTASDGDFFLIVMSQDHWRSLAEAIGRTDWLSEPELADAAGRGAAMSSQIRPAIAEWASRRSRREVLDQLRGVRLAVSPVNNPADILADPHFKAREMIETVVRSDGRTLRVVGNPIKLSSDSGGERPARISVPGAHNRELLIDRFGLSAERFDQLVADGVVGQSR